MILLILRSNLRDFNVVPLTSHDCFVMRHNSNSLHVASVNHWQQKKRQKKRRTDFWDWEGTELQATDGRSSRSTYQRIPSQHQRRLLYSCNLTKTKIALSYRHSPEVKW